MRRDGADPGRLDRVERDAGVLDTLIEEALQISRLRANDPQLVREPLDLADLARDALREYDHPVDAQLSSVVLFGDRKLLLRALRNVLANVERHALSDRPLRVRCDAGCIEFRDHGPGIADHEMDRVFEPYVRATGDPGGSGLGLSIVHRVMELHGGTVTLENHDRGLSVRLDFPQSHV
jgi:signal transduction histidine kinase